MNGYIVTTNASFSKHLFNICGKFDESLGHRGRVLLGGEDIDFFHRIVKEGKSVRYLADAIVVHSVDSERITRKWLIKRMFWEGIGIAYIKHRNTRPPLRKLTYDARQVVKYALEVFAGRQLVWKNAHSALKYAGQLWAELSMFFEK
jgi:hypothetical protein